MTNIIELYDDFRMNQEILARKVKYIELCMYRLNRFKIFIESEFKINKVEDINQIHIKKYIQFCQQQGIEKAITINGSIATLRVFFNYLVEEEFLDEFDNPMRRIKNMKEEKTVIVTFNDDEVQRVINDIAEETYSNVRDKLILIFLFDTGIRVSELCDIKLRDISTKQILINGKGSKQRLVYISKTMRKYMRKYEQMRRERFKRKGNEEVEDYYFLDQCAKQLHRSRINKILKEHCKNAGVRSEVRCSPHDCRHYFAQKQLKNGLDVYSLSRLLGHYDTDITAKYLRGLEQNDILRMGMLSSPLNEVKIKKK